MLYNSRVKKLLAFVLLASTLSFAQWKKLNSGTDASLRGVSAVDASVCWATGSQGTVLRTTDGGSHWTKLPVPGGENLDFRDVEAFDASKAIIMSAGLAEQGAAKIFKTTDAGAHWKEVFTTDRKGIFLDSMAFWDSNRGIVFSDPVDRQFVLFTTDDGGDHWKQLHPRSMPPALQNEGAFAASGTAIAVAGKHDVWFGTGGASVSRVFHSPDGGQHWWVSETPIAAGKASAGIFGVAFRDSKHGVAVGGDYLRLKEKFSAIATTEDGGVTWKIISTPMLPLEGVVFARNSFYVLGSGFVIVDPSGTALRPDDSVFGNALSFACSGKKCTLYIAGPKGAIQKHDFAANDR